MEMTVQLQEGQQSEEQRLSPPYFLWSAVGDASLP